MGDLTTLASVKAYANITGTDATRDALLEDLIDGASAAMERYVGRALSSATYTDEKLDSAGFETLILEHIPVTTFTNLKQDGVTLASTMYDVDGAAGLVYATSALGWASDGIGGAWTPGRRLYTATYVAGYLTMPEDIVNAANRQVLLEYKRSGYKGDRLGLATTTLPDGATASFRDEEWAEGVEGVLLRYRRLL